ncbi:hypothetical protein AXE83_00590 [Streptococcus sp. oral taxon 431]|uniref:hypothetical protein n=1 Tax=Streptococcus sp. oral taxon 431 TaxID=712633 RepID=UPI0007682022|nr:hypothetical protein [Streptococcus sp. oral taxon 431]AMD96169.1 hypothetical protein AXE83_00590 [Streptococcus sp. oral taxon 431]
MNETLNQLVMESLSKKLAQVEIQAAQNEVFYLFAASELQKMNEVLEYDPALKELFEEVKGKMTNGNQ